jgi:hypothetical protein
MAAARRVVEEAIGEHLDGTPPGNTWTVEEIVSLMNSN